MAARKYQSDLAFLDFDGLPTFDFSGLGRPPAADRDGTEDGETLLGTSEDDNLNGLGGDDILQGLAGMDTLNGGAGADEMTGGLGGDVFVFAFTAGEHGSGVDGDPRDVITDFGRDDLIRFDAPMDGQINFSNGPSTDADTVWFRQTTDGTEIVVNRTSDADAETILLQGVDYALNAVFENGALIITPQVADDQFGSSVTSGEFLLDGSSVSGEIELHSDTDWFRFESSTGQTVTFRMTLDTLSAGTLQLFDTDGNSIVSSSDIDPDTGEVILTFSFDKRAVYYIAAEPLNDGDDATDATGTYSLSASIDPLIQGTDANDILVGTADDNTIIGGAGNDQMTGLGGDDVFLGGLGNDIIDGGDGRDTVDYSGVISVDSQQGFFIGANQADGAPPTIFVQGPFFDTLTNIEHLILSDKRDSLFLGNNIELNITLETRGGDDFVSSGGGDDTILLGDGRDFVRTNAGHDVFDGGNGSDTISFFANDATQGVVADLRTGTVSNDGFGDQDTLISIENLSQGTRFADVYDGNDDDNGLGSAGFGDTVRAHGGDDSLSIEAAGTYDGGAGNDVLFMSTGRRLSADLGANGQLQFEGATQGIEIDLMSGVIVNDGFGDSGTATNFENITVAGQNRLSIDLAGTDGDNSIIAFTLGDSLIDGRGGDDMLRGYLGDDVFIGGDGNDEIEGDGGFNTVQLAGNLANYSITADGARGFIVTDNVGTDGTDILRNIDRIIGADGEEFLIEQPAIAVTVEDAAITMRQAFDLIAAVISDFEVGTISADQTSVTGTIDWNGETIDVTLGGQVFNTFGQDSLAVGIVETISFSQAGNPLLNVADAFLDIAYINELSEIEASLPEDGGNIRAIEDYLQRIDWAFDLGEAVDVWNQFELSEDNTTFSFDGNDVFRAGAGDDQLFGGGGDDQLFGGDGDDGLNGGLGRDMLTGGAGADNFFFESGNFTIEDDVVLDLDMEDEVFVLGAFNFGTQTFVAPFMADGGFSGTPGEIVTVFEGTGTRILIDSDGDGLEDEAITVEGSFLLEASSAGNGIRFVRGVDVTPGSQMADMLMGTEGDDTLFGLGGDDSLDGGLGDDLINGGEGRDDLFGGDGNDDLIGDDGFLTLPESGRRGPDSEADLLDGGAGNDRLSGGLGDDALYGDSVIALTSTTLEASLYRAYRAVFDRDPDAAGFDAFLTALRLETITQEEIIAEFVGSTEFQDTYGTLDNRGFIEQLYRNVFGRDGDTEGVNAFTAALDGGRDRAEVVTEFANSLEFLQRVSEDSGAFASSVIELPEEAEVFRAYQAVFDRAPDDVGFNNFTIALVAGVLTLEDMVAEFVASAEFQATYGDLSNADFVELLYTNVLPGNDDQLGRDAFTAALDNGSLTREAMVAEFVQSFEFRGATEAEASAFIASVYDGNYDDMIIGGAGDDVLFGGRGDDVFMAGEGADQILDFQIGSDAIDLSELGEGFDSFDEVMAASTQDGLNTLIDFGDGNTLTLANIQMGDLSASDFGLGGTAQEPLTGLSDSQAEASAMSASSAPLAQSPINSDGSLSFDEFDSQWAELWNIYL